MQMGDLPAPDDPEVPRLLGNRERLEAYRILYEARARDDELTMVEIRERMAESLGTAHAQTDRRVRELREHFVVRAIKHGRYYRYRLEERAASRPAASLRTRISSKTEAEAYSRFGNRCAMCGQSPAEDGIRLVLDHKIPLAWGGANDLDNLQPLCVRHNHGKQAHFASFDRHAA